jgi:hypothetical protein
VGHRTPGADHRQAGRRNRARRQGVGRRSPERRQEGFLPQGCRSSGRHRSEVRHGVGHRQAGHRSPERRRGVGRRNRAVDRRQVGRRTRVADRRQVGRRSPGHLPDAGRRSPVRYQEVDRLQVGHRTPERRQDEVPRSPARRQEAGHRNQVHHQEAGRQKPVLLAVAGRRSLRPSEGNPARPAAIAASAEPGRVLPGPASRRRSWPPVPGAQSRPVGERRSSDRTGRCPGSSCGT